MTVRVDEHGHAVQDGPQVEIGGNDRYVSVSRAEFKKITRGEGRIDPAQAPCRCRGVRQGLQPCTCCRPLAGKQQQQLAFRGMAGRCRTAGTLQVRPCRLGAASMRLTPCTPTPPHL
jgi:hypothetical protein